ncbi:MAG: AraC family ligand binding domain-containing protein, partial [Spirochaetia bacterium]|nr:AraC family ligand binding domain-containing protein [Spirochaetia bacterium]
MKKWALPCFSINWIVSGGGWFESVATGKMAVKSGDAVLRFPYEPVRYGPEEGGEWSDFWMLFEGAQIEKLHKRTWIQPEHPVIQYPVTSKSLALWRQWIHWGSQRPPLLDRMAVQFQSWWLEGILAQSKHFSSREPV